MIDYPRKLHNRLTLDTSQKQSEDFIKNIKSNRDAAMHRSLQGKGAGAWLDVIPSYKNGLKPNEFRLASCMRLGISLPFSRLLSIVTVERSLKELGVSHQIEPRNRYVQTDGRPDITFYDIASGVT